MKRLRDDPHMRPLFILAACIVGLALIDPPAPLRTDALALAETQRRSRYLPVERVGVDGNRRQDLPADHGRFQVEYLDAVFDPRRERLRALRVEAVPRRHVARVDGHDDAADNQSDV